MKKKPFIKTVKERLRGGWFNDDSGYKVNVGRYTYYIRIMPEKNRHGDITWYAIDVGGTKRGCVSIRIPTMAAVIPGVFDAKQGVLKYVKYDAMCSVNKDRDFTSGFGTKHMLKTALYFAKELCPDTDIQSFRFIDTSRKDCLDGAVVDLPYFMIALYGKTYYEKYYYARLKDDRDVEKYKHALARLNLTPRETIPFDEFDKKFELNDHQANTLQPLYDAADSFTAFFQSIRQKYPSTICQLVQRWVNKFVVMWLFSNDDLTERVWIIPSDKISSIEVDDWEIVTKEIISMDVLNREQHGGNGYLGVWDPNEE